MTLPTPGGDNNNWGNIINANYTALDALFPSTPGSLADNTVPRYTSLGALVAAGVTVATTADPTTTQVAITLDGSNNLDVTMATGGPAMEISQATGVVNFDKPPTIGGVSTPAGLGIGEIRTGLGTSDIVYSNGEAWLVCSGRTLSAGEQTTYATYVAAHGATLPQFGNRTPRGYLAGTTVGPGIAVTGSADTVTLSQANLPSHTHTLAGASISSTDSGHTHSANLSTGVTLLNNAGSNSGVSVIAGQAAGTIIASGNTNSASAIITSTLTSLTLNNTGSGSAFSVVPASTIITYFVRVA